MSVADVVCEVCAERSLHSMNALAAGLGCVFWGNERSTCQPKRVKCVCGDWRMRG